MTPHQAWHAWTFEPAVVGGVAVSAWAYARGVRALWSPRAGRGVGRWRAAAFAGGLVAVVAALVSPLDAVADHLLSVHMAQHLLLVVVAAPLLVLGSPGTAFAAALPVTWRRRSHRLGRARALRWSRRTATNPVVAWLLATAVLWAWHLPGAYDAAVENGLIHVLEHGSFLASAVLFWWVALSPSGARRLPRGGDIVYVFGGALQSGALGALLAFAPSPIYAVYVRRTVAWGASRLADQQLAGLLMWVPSFVVYLLAAGALFVGWLRSVERASRRTETAAAASEVSRGV